MALSPDCAKRSRGSRIIIEAMMSEREKFRSGALENKYGSPPLQGGKTYFICFSSAEKFLAQRVELSTIFSPARRVVNRRFTTLRVHKLVKESSTLTFSCVKTRERTLLQACDYFLFLLHAIMIFVRFLLLAQKKTNQK